ncbi:6-bladed beta-propeller [Algoriphagus sp. D3-2-R+10]|uniref:6-bladed beta-propeller n=1 Tax=Algoriphagus aurantiacus TaxID=3103948 RepID=UPI002B38205E|nr:6-bladed beta-propeller [Algoriphagus sp. D3-2-R+10]MEB2774939.1 6-bladed beta-propeller [Algoriphagus sp. D3-2-R+10]
MHKILIPAFYIFLLLSCTSNKEAAEDLNLKEIDLISDNLLITKILPLATTQSNLLGPFLNVKYTREHIWVLDKDNSDAIHGFNWKGESIGYVAERGEAPGQLLGLLDFSLKGEQILALSNSGDEIEISSFSTDNNMLSQVRIPFNCFTFWENEAGGYWLYSGYNSVSGEYRLLSTDSQGEIVEKYLKNDFNDKMIPLSESSFFHGSQETLFRESFKQEIYSITENGLDLKYQFDFSELKVPESYWEMDAIPGFEMIDRNGFANIEFVAENSQFVIFDIFLQKEGVIWKEFVIQNKDSKEARKIKVNTEINGHLMTPIGLENDTILFISYAPYLVQNKQNLNLSQEALSVIDTINEDDNPAIFYAKIPNL